MVNNTMQLKTLIFYLYIGFTLLVPNLSAYADVATSQVEIEEVETEVDEVKTEKETWITIFVHGIMSIKPHLNTNNFLKFMRDEVENTTYSKTVELMRQDPHFYKNQAMQGFGLKKIDLSHVAKGCASNALSLLFNEIYALSHGKSIENHCYTFGWSGLMSETRRYKDAFELYGSLEAEIVKFQAQNIRPKIRIIGYSHGGNVVLNLGAVRQREAVRKDLEIDETILLGMPVQCETDYLVKDPVFKKIYHIYSHGDRVQKLDFFSYKRFFSNRIFKERQGFTLPKKLVQIQLKLTRHTPKSKVDKKKFELTYNWNNQAIVSGKSHLLRDSSPGHAELWFFGWTPVHYRKTFALAPLPTAAIIPFIIKTVDDIKDTIYPQYPIIVDMRPENGITLVKNVKGNKFHKAVDFIPRDVFNKLKALVEPYKPDDYSNKEYEQHIYTAYETAHEHFQNQWSKKAKRRDKRLSKKRKKNKQKIVIAQNN
jgi:hypothetical protein